MNVKHDNWFRQVFQLRGSVIPNVLPRAALCGMFAGVVYICSKYGLTLNTPFLGSFIANIVLGLLLVFRTNTAYERFWEGRKAWGTLVNTTRNLARQIWVSVGEIEPSDRKKKIAALRLLVAFAVSMKLHLRHRSLNAELAALVMPSQFKKLQQMHHPSLEIAFWIGDYMQKQYERGCLAMHQLVSMHDLLAVMVDVLGSCERIQKTPIPIAYAIHLRQLLLIYCLSLPFQLVSEIGWLTIPTTALASFTLMGIEEIGVEIEDPFGCDPNDLPLNAICSTMLRNIEDLISLSSCRSLSTIDASIDYLITLEEPIEQNPYDESGNVSSNGDRPVDNLPSPSQP
ncbi:hypothetical protein Pse7367_2101 [Thalassoporum mexicanum PCC 7367]|uniref:bestrophin family protein n=1 Tax=Thalassoporum mexicanum TaxID=3457544 RepID=UPI00029F8E2D|nr:bestrophin family ion channel [Pseudanabaena sp. PCC 7367]AFY70368.1 hypothetical protein Pse7367_2101 [Pseudanabaena sp. PCC 7367]